MQVYVDWQSGMGCMALGALSRLQDWSDGEENSVLISEAPPEPKGPPKSEASLFVPVASEHEEGAARG